MTVTLTTRTAKGTALTQSEMDGNLTALKSAIDSVTDAATVTTIADTATSLVSITESGTPKKITLDNLIAEIGSTASELAAASTLSGSDVITLSQDGGATEVRTTLSALAVFLGMTPEAATGVTMSGPSSGLTSVASTNFTLGLTPSGGTVTGTVTVTPSDGDDGGTFTPTTRGLTTGSPTATFTYTPASSGAKTISVTNDGSLSNPSNITYTASDSATVPGAPTSVVGTRGNGQVSVAFSAPASDGGATITGYTATSSPGSFTQSGSASPLVVTGLTNGTGYTFTVTATNSVGTGSASSASSAVTPATVPGAPTIGTPTAGDASVSVAFTAPASNGGSAITGYTVTSSPGSFTGTGSASPINVTGLTNDTEYTFTVTATNAVGTGSASSASAGTTPTGGTSYTISPYGGGSWSTTRDATSDSTYGGYKFFQHDVSSTGYAITSPAIPTLTCEFGWGASDTVAPSSTSTNDTAGHNGMVTRTHNGTAYSVGGIYLWLLASEGATQTWHFWAKPAGGTAQKLFSKVISNI